MSPDLSHAFVQRRDAIQRLARELEQRCREWPRPEPLHWGHVGDLERIEHALREALAAMPRLKGGSNPIRPEITE